MVQLWHEYWPVTTDLTSGSVARRLRGWECEVIYSDVIQIPSDVEQETRARRVELDELLSTSDLITLHVPLDRSTHHMISTREFELMKSTARTLHSRQPR